MGLNADADSGQGPEAAPAPSERDGVVDRTAAGIQHDGGAAKLASVRKFIEIPGAVGGDEADPAYPSPAIRLARHPAYFPPQLRVFGSTPGRRRASIGGAGRGRCAAKGPGAGHRPTPR